MSRLTLDFLVAGDDTVALELRGLGFRAADAQPAFAVLEAEFEENHARWFSSRGSGTWSPLRPSTKKRKRKQGLTSAPLFGATGKLHASLTEHTEDSVRYFSPDSLVFGTSVPYARFHRYGTEKMDERNPLVRSVFLERQAVETLTEFLVGPLGRRYTRKYGARQAGWWR